MRHSYFLGLLPAPPCINHTDPADAGYAIAASSGASAAAAGRSALRPAAGV